MNSNISFLVSDNLQKLETDYSWLLALIKEELELRKQNNGGKYLNVFVAQLLLEREAVG